MHKTYKERDIDHSTIIYSYDDQNLLKDVWDQKIIMSLPITICFNPYIGI